MRFHSCKLMTWNHLDSDMLVHVLTRCHFEMMKDPRRKDGFEDIPKLTQYWKSSLRVAFNHMTLKSKMIPLRTMDIFLEF